jgi:alkyl hydroperoxide reductase subunit AhpC
VDGPEETEAMLERVRSEHDQALDFPLLSDPGSAVIGRYGLLNPDGRGWPHPTVLLIDRDGVVRWRFMEVDYRERATNEDILAALAELREPAADRPEPESGNPSADHPVGATSGEPHDGGR